MDNSFCKLQTEDGFFFTCLVCGKSIKTHNKQDPSKVFVHCASFPPEHKFGLIENQPNDFGNPTQQQEDTSQGPGTILHRRIQKYIRADMKSGCDCAETMKQMNEWGSVKCRENKEWIVDRMMEEAKKRGWKFTRIPGLNLATKQGAKLLVTWAIRKSERTHER